MTEATMPVTVEQCDRDFAAQFTKRSHGKIGGYTFSAEYMIRNGHWDDDPLVQAAAHYRLNIRATPPSPTGLTGDRSTRLGLYQVEWHNDEGGTSLASVYMDSAGDRWIAPTNWMRPAKLTFDPDCWHGVKALTALTANGSQPDRVVDVLRDIVSSVRGSGPYARLHDADTLAMIGKAAERALSTLDAKDQT